MQKTFRCRFCPKDSEVRFANRRELHAHQTSVHLLNQVGGEESLQPRPFNTFDAPWNVPVLSTAYSQGLKKNYEDNIALILRQNEYSDTESLLNVPMPGHIDVDRLMSAIRTEFFRCSHPFKVNISCGLILYHTQEFQFRLFLPFLNTAIFSLPPLISDEQDLDQLEEKLRSMDLTSYLLQQRPDTKYIPVMVTHAAVNIWFLTDLAIGCDHRKLPDFLRLNRGLELFKTRGGIECEDDNLCFFRCVSYFLHSNSSSTLALNLYKKWVAYCKQRNIKDCCLLDEGKVQGITLCNIPLAEDLFQINIEVYQLDSALMCQPVMRSMKLHDKTLLLNLDDSNSHFLYIKDFSVFAKKFKCSSCEKVFRGGSLLTRHFKSCENISGETYPGGFVNNADTIFTRLAYMNIDVAKDRQFCRDFLFFDCESLLLTHRENISSSTNLNQKHKPVSIGVASTIEGYKDGKVFLNEDETALLKEFVQYISQVQKKFEMDMYFKYEDVVKQILRLYYLWKPDENVNNAVDTSCEDSDGEICSDQAVESSHCEPPSREFLDALKKPNSWRNFCSNLDQDRWGVDNPISSDEDDDVENSSEQSDSLTTSHDVQIIDEDYESLFTTAMGNYKVEPEFTRAELDLVKYCSPGLRKAMFNRVSKLYTDFSEWASQLPITSYNGSSYDLNLVKRDLFRMIDMKKSMVIKKGNRYRMINTKRYKFIDVLSYCPANCSYRQFLKCWAPDSDQQKLFFPYSLLSNFSNLSLQQLPQYDDPAWISDLDSKHLLEEGQGREVGIENYNKMLQIWEEKNIQNLKEWLILYNIHDCSPAIDGFSRMREMYEQKNVCILKQVISTPGVARVLLFDHAQKKNIHFSLFDEKDKELKKKVDASIVAGPALVFRRWCEKDVTYIDPEVEIERNGPSVGNAQNNSSAKNAQNNFRAENEQTGDPGISATSDDADCVTSDAKVKLICGYDATGLYNHALSQDLPTGNYIKRRVERGFQAEIREKYELQYAYFNYLNDVQGRTIKHRQNLGRESFIGPYKIDGVDVGGATGAPKKCYEVLGCYFHGCKCFLTKHKHDDKEWLEKANKEQIKLQKRKEHLKILGYSPVFIKECELRALYRTDQKFKYYVDSQRPEFYQKFKNKCTEQDIIEGLKSGLFFGIVECSVSLPADDKFPDDCKYKPDDSSIPMSKFFEDFPALFGHKSVQPEHFGAFMTDFAEREGLDISKPRDLLISTNKSEGLMLASPYLKLLLEFGFQVHNISLCIEYRPHKVFRDLMLDYTNIRRESDSDPSRAILGQTAKLLGNSSYGSLLLAQNKFRSVSFVKGKKNASKKINNKRFCKMDTISAQDELYEIESLKSQIKFNMPVQLGFFVLNWAKVRILQFYYLFLKKFLKDGSFKPVLMDTDSVYICLADEFEKCIKPSKMAEYQAQLHNFCTEDEVEIAENQFFFRRCCPHHERYDERQCGRFHTEYRGHLTIALSAKCYFAENFDSGSVKYSCKGVQKRLIDKTGVDYKNTFKNQKHISKRNRGFFVRQNHVFTYEQERNALSLFYCKRVVAPGGSVTYALDIPVGPKRQKPEPVPIPHQDAFVD